MVEEQLKTINLLNDAMFKSLFRSKNARRMFSRFLNSVTGIEMELLLNAEYVGGELTKQIKTEKGKTADIIISLVDGNKIIVENNQYQTDYIFLKNASYAFSNFIESTKIGSNKYPKNIIINIDNFNYFKDEESIHDVLPRDQFGNIETYAYRSIHIVLENVVKNKYNLDKEIVQFVEFLRTTDITDLEDKVKGDEDYMAAFRTVEDLSKDPKFIGYYDYEQAHKDELEHSRLTGIRIGKEQGIEEGIEKGIKQGIKQGIEQGIEKGIEKGIEQGIALSVKNMHEKGMSISEIADIMKEKVETIEQILKN